MNIDNGLYDGMLPLELPIGMRSRINARMVSRRINAFALRDPESPIGMSFAQQIQEELKKRYAECLIETIDCAIEGNGTGEIKGILNSAPAPEVTWENVKDMYRRMLPEGHKE